MQGGAYALRNCSTDKTRDGSLPSGATASLALRCRPVCARGSRVEGQRACPTGVGTLVRAGALAGSGTGDAPGAECDAGARGPRPHEKSVSIHGSGRPCGSLVLASRAGLRERETADRDFLSRRIVGDVHVVAEVGRGADAQQRAAKADVVHPVMERDGVPEQQVPRLGGRGEHEAEPLRFDALEVADPVQRDAVTRVSVLREQTSSGTLFGCGAGVYLSLTDVEPTVVEHEPESACPGPASQLIALHADVACSDRDFWVVESKVVVRQLADPSLAGAYFWDERF